MILATADLHGTLPEDFPESDVLIIAGDICPDVPVAQQLAFLDGPFRNWLLDQRATNIVGIAGNHDFVVEKWKIAVRELLLPWTYLEDRLVKIQGVNYYGIPWVPNLSGWAFHADDHQLDLYFDQVPSITDVVISHGPPHMYCDLTVPSYGGVHAGSPHAVEMLDRVQPEALVCGHIHEGYGTAKRGPTTIYNVALNDETYDPINPPMEVSLRG